MEKSLEMKFKDVLFNFEQLNLFSTLLEQEPLHKEVMFFIVQQFLNASDNANSKANIKSITENIQVERKVGVKKKGSSLKFDNKIEYISRKMAESIVKQLGFASLIYTESVGQFKYIGPTSRGVLVYKFLDKKDKYRNNEISKEEYEEYLRKIKTQKF